MSTTKQNRSIYLDEEIELIQQAALRSAFNLYETDAITRKRGDGYKTCGKAIFRDLEEVKGALFRIRTKRTKTENLGVETKRQERRSYFCNRCHGLHITSQADRFAVEVSNAQAA